MITQILEDRGLATKRKTSNANSQAEETLIGTLIYYPDSFKNVSDKLAPEDFISDQTRFIFKAMITLQQNDQEIDLLNLIDVLSGNGGLAKIGGKQYLSKLVGEEVVGTSAVIPHLIDQIKADAQKRNATLSLLHAQDKLKAGEPVDEVLSETTTDLEALKEKPIIEEEAPDPVLFPDVMAGPAGEFADVYSSYLEVPRHFLYMSFLTCLGSILADKVRICSELNTQPRLYTILLGESADDRKSTAILKVVGFFKDTLTKEGFGVCWGVGSAEGLQSRFQRDKNLLLAFDEFKQFINKCKIEASVLLPAVNSLFEMNLYETYTKTSNIKIEDAHLTILAASTVQTWERIWTPAFTDIGFYNRLWLVPGMGERKFSLPAKIPEEKKQSIRTGLVDILKSIGQGMELDLTDEAKELYQEWYMDLLQSIHTKRLDTYSMRLMALLAINESKNEIDKGIIEKVIALANWQLEVRRLHDPVDAETKTARLEEKIRRVLKSGPKSDRELKQNTHANREGLWYYNMAISNLQKANEIGWEKQRKLWRLS